MYIHKNNVDDFSSVAIMCQEDLTESLLKHLITMFSLDGLSLVIEYLDFDKIDYDGEYVMAITVEDGEVHLSIEKAKCDNDEYKLVDLDHVYICDNCSNELKSKNIRSLENVDVFSIY